MKRKKILICFSVLLISSCTINIHAQTESVMIANDIGNAKVYKNTTHMLRNYTNNNEITENVENVGSSEVSKDIQEAKEEIEEEVELEKKQQEVLEKQEQLKTIQDKKEWFLAYKELIEEYSEWFDPPETIYDYYTEDEIYLMQKCIETETFEADFDSKVNVANVIFNRMESEEFSDNVYDVIVPGQFAFGRNNISEDTVLALEYAFMIGDTTNGALYFHSLSYTPTFNGASYIFTDELGHHFYK